MLSNEDPDENTGEDQGKETNENESINEYKIKSTTLFQQQEAQFQVLEEKYEEKAKNSTLINKGFKVGDQVQHALFGIGTVLVINGSGEHQKVGVEFDGGLRKKLILKYAKLKKI